MVAFEVTDTVCLFFPRMVRVEACQERISQRDRWEEPEDVRGASLSREQKTEIPPSTRNPVLLLLLDFAVVVQAFAFAKSGLARSSNPGLASHRIYIYIHIYHAVNSSDMRFLFRGLSCDELSGCDITHVVMVFS